MSRSIGLRQYLLVFGASLSILLATAYAVLLNYSYLSGIDEAMQIEVELKAIRYKRDFLADKRTPLPSDSYTQSFVSYEGMPLWAKSPFPHWIYPHRYFEFFSVCGDGKRGCDEEPGAASVRLLVYEINDERKIFLLSRFDANDFSSEQGLEEQSVQSYTAYLSALPIMIVLISGILLVWQLIKPMRQLAGWVENLDKETLDEDPPGFTFNELNFIANRFKYSFSRISDALENEHRFLRNASHELRTPIAIISSNVELINKIRIDHKGSEARSMQRISRAVKDMTQLTETILWLSREEESYPSSEPVRLGNLVRSLVEDNSYLLVSKNVEVNISDVEHEVNVAATPCRITITNLIRNAFQYTDAGTVDIDVSAKGVSVRNQNTSDSEQNHNTEEYGFGLGLTLVEQITERLNWIYHHEEIQGGRLVTISFC